MFLKFVRSLSIIILLITLLPVSSSANGDPLFCQENPSDPQCQPSFDPKITYNNETATSVTKNITLSSGATWTSANSSLIEIQGHTGIVKRPSYTSGNQTVKLTAQQTGQSTQRREFTLTVLALPITGPEAITIDEPKVSVGYSNNDSATSVTQNVTLATVIANSNTKVEWSSNKPSVISSTGVVTRPAYTSANETVILTAKLTTFTGTQDTTREKTFEVTVLKKEQTLQDKLTDAHSSLAVNFANGDNANSVTTNLPEPTAISNEFNVTWTSSNHLIKKENDGFSVIRPSYTDGDKTVTITATIQAKADLTVVKTKEFVIKVKALPITKAEILALDQNLVVLTPQGSDTFNTITQNVTISFTPSQVNEPSQIRWTSSREEIAKVSGDGTTVQITRPRYDEGIATVVLTATLTNGDATPIERPFTLKVLPTPPTDDEQLLLDSQAIAIGYAPLDNQDHVRSAITLPTTLQSGTIVQWSSNHLAISAQGAVVRPTYKETDLPVTLTATLTRGTKSKVMTFTLTVLKSEMTNAERLEEDAKTLQLLYAIGDSNQSVTKAINVQFTPTYGTTLSFESNPFFTYENGILHVTRPSFIEGDKETKVLAKLTNSSSSQLEKPFILTIKKLPPTDVEAVNQVKVNVVSADGDSLLETTQNVKLVVTNNDFNSNVTWTSSRPDVISTTGIVTRPRFHESDQTVTLTATIQRGTEKQTKSFNLVVLRQAKWTNAFLKQLAVQNGTLSFAKETLSYRVILPFGTTATKLTAIPEDERAFVTVNGLELSPNRAIDLKVKQGENKITITVTSESSTIQKSYIVTVVVVEPVIVVPPSETNDIPAPIIEIPKNENNTSPPVVVTPSNERTVFVTPGTNKGNPTPVMIKREGTVDNVKLEQDKTKDSVDKALKANDKAITLFVPDDAQNPATKINVTIPTQSLTIVQEKELALNVSTDRATIQLPATTVATLAKKDVSIQVSTVSTTEQKTTQQVANTIASGATLVSTPLKIETNFSEPTTLQFPASQGVNGSVYVLVQHTDGENVLYKATKVDNHYEINVNKFSTFTLVTAPEVRIDGPLLVGETLTAVTSSPVSALEWYRNGKLVSEGVNYRLTKADLHATLYAQVKNTPFRSATTEKVEADRRFDVTKQTKTFSLKNGKLEARGELAAGEHVHILAEIAPAYMIDRTGTFVLNGQYTTPSKALVAAAKTKTVIWKYGKLDKGQIGRLVVKREIGYTYNDDIATALSKTYVGALNVYYYRPALYKIGDNLYIVK